MCLQTFPSEAAEAAREKSLGTGEVQSKRRAAKPKKVVSVSSCDLGFVAFVKKLLTWCGRGGTPLARFLGQYYVPSSRQVLTRWRGLSGSRRPYPCLPPYRLGLLKPPEGVRSRKRSRYTQEWGRRILTNAAVGMLSWQALNRPEFMTPAMLGEPIPFRDEHDESAQREELRAVSLAAVECLQVEVRALSRETFRGVSGGRSTLVPLLLSMIPHRYDGGLSEKDFTALLQLEEEELNERVGQLTNPKLKTSRAGLPAQSAALPILEWLQSSWGDVLRNPKEKLLDPEPPGTCPRRYHACDDDEWKLFVAKKAAAGMAMAVGLSAVPVGPQGQDLWSGVFPVAKSADEDRVIDDRRRMNWRDRRWPGRKPAHGVHYIKGRLRPGRRKEYFVLDAPHFYHNLYAGAAHLPHAPTGPPMKRSDLIRLGVPIAPEWDDGGEFLQVCTTTICMGDSKGVALAQESHLNMARAAGLRTAWLTSWEGPDPREDGVRASLCIDDLLGEQNKSTQKGRRGAELGEEELARLKQREEIVETFMTVMLELYEELGIPPKPSKIQWKLDIVVSLGAELNGLSGRVGVPLRTISQIQMLTLYVAAGGAVTKKAAQKLLGLWVFALMFRREAFALLESIFPEVEKLSETVPRPLVASAKDELMSLILVGPLLRANMRWPVGEDLFATDAEGSGGSAIVEAKVSEGFREELYRYAGVKGDYAKLEGDATQLAAAEKWEEEVTIERDRVANDVKKAAVDLTPNYEGEYEEPFPGLAVGRRLQRNLRAKGWPVLGVQEDDRKEPSSGSSEGVCDSTFCINQELWSRARHSLPGSISRPLEAVCWCPGKRNEAILSECCTGVAPGGFLERRILCWGPIDSDLAARLQKNHWLCLDVQKFVRRLGAKQVRLVLEILDRAAWAGCFSGWLQSAEPSPNWEYLSKRIEKVGGFKVVWSTVKTPRSLHWTPSKEGESDRWVSADKRSWAMLVGLEGGVLERESESRFLEGRRGTASYKSLVKGLEERQSNVSASRDIKRRAWARTPWEPVLSNLVEVLPWKLSMRWDDCRKEEEHINVLETRAKRRLISRLARNVKYHSKRHLHVTDSRVTEAVTMRGRSSSVRLNRELRLLLPDILGADITVPTFWVESARMPAEEPSRRRRILDAAEPTQHEKEILLGTRPPLSAGVVREWQRGKWNPRPPPPLRRLVYNHRGERIGAASHPGPRTKKVRSRSVPLSRTRLEKTTMSYERGFSGLRIFLQTKDMPSPKELAESHPRIFCEALQAWVKDCYMGMQTKDFAVAGLLRFAELFWWCRPQLKPVWQLIEEWEHREPTEHRAPAPAPVLQAVVALALAWEWPRVAAILWLMFHCLLRPGEAVDLLCGDFTFVKRGTRGVYVVVIRDPKTQRKFARTQHVICEEWLLVCLLKKLLKGRSKKERFYTFTAATLSARLTSLLAALGVANLFTLGGLRAGGATHEWIVRRNFDGLRLRGRWLASRTLEFYVQECVAELALGGLGDRQRSQLERLGKLGCVLVEEFLSK